MRRGKRSTLFPLPSTSLPLSASLPLCRKDMRSDSKGGIDSKAIGNKEAYYRDKRDLYERKSIVRMRKRNRMPKETWYCVKETYQRQKRLNSSNKQRVAS